MKLYKTYEFRGQDPAVREVLAAVGGKTRAEVARTSGVSGSTISGWAKGKVKRPQFATLQAVARSGGQTFRLTKLSGKRGG